MASSMKKYDTDEEEEDLETSQWYGVREATLFLVDATQKMFEVDPETERSYIHGFFKVSNIFLWLLHHLSISNVY